MATIINGEVLDDGTDPQPEEVELELLADDFDTMPPDCQEAMTQMIAAAVDAARAGKLQNAKL